MSLPPARPQNATHLQARRRRGAVRAVSALQQDAQRLQDQGVVLRVHGRRRLGPPPQHDPPAHARLPEEVGHRAGGVVEGLWWSSGGW